MDEEIKVRFEGMEGRISRLEEQLKAKRPVELWDAVCFKCGRDCKVPFRPRYGDKPIFCKECYQKFKKGQIKV